MLPVSLPDVERLVVKVAAAKSWHDKASKVFVRKGFAKLLEVRFSIYEVGRVDDYCFVL